MKDRFKLIIFILIILITILFIIFYNVIFYFHDPKYNILLISMGLVIGIAFILLSIYIAINVINRSKNLVIEKKDFLVREYFRKYSYVIMLTLLIGILFIQLSFIEIYIYILNFGVIVACFISCYLSTYYYDYLKKHLIPERAAIMRFRSIIEGHEKISIFELQKIFKEDKEFYDKLLKWVDQFNFSIDGDMLILNEESLEEFINLLDKQYKDWSKKERVKFKKIN